MTDMDMKLQEQYYRQILSGDKTVEGRASGPSKDYDQLDAGDTIRFIPVDESFQETSVEGLPEQAVYEIEGVEKYPSVGAMFNMEGVRNVLPDIAEQAETAEEAVEDGVNLYHSISNYDERIPEHGIFAIRLGERLE